MRAALTARFGWRSAWPWCCRGRSGRSWHGWMVGWEIASSKVGGPSWRRCASGRQTVLNACCRRQCSPMRGSPALTRVRGASGLGLDRTIGRAWRIGVLVTRVQLSRQPLDDQRQWRIARGERLVHGRVAGHVGVVPWVQVSIEDSSGDRRYLRARVLHGQLSIWRMTRRRHQLPMARGCARVVYRGARRGGISGGARRAGSAR